MFLYGQVDGEISKIRGTIDEGSEEAFNFEAAMYSVALRSEQLEFSPREACEKLADNFVSHLLDECSINEAGKFGLDNIIWKV